MSSIIDIHPHVISPDTKRYPLAPLGGKQSTCSSERPIPYEDLIKAMNEAGVAKAAIVHSSTAYGYDNSYVATAVVAGPKRFTGVFSVDVLAPDAVEKMDYWLRQGFNGMRLITTGSTMPGQVTLFTDAKIYPAWEHAAAKGIPVCVQMTQQGIPHLRGITDKFPKVRIILDQLSRTAFTDGPPFAAAAD
jgi:L-fuconolactonase